MSCLHCSTNGKLHILLKAQPSTASTWPLPPTRLGIQLRDLGLPNEYTLGHCGSSVASQALLTTHSYMTRQHFLLCKKQNKTNCWSKLIFKVSTTTWGASPSHILTKLIINALLDANADRKLGKSIKDSQNWLFANRLRRRVGQHGFPGLST